jgi:plasmid maintenance system killer protein
VRIVLSNRAADAVADAPAQIQKAFYKQLRYLAHDRTHPSLRAKKYDEANDIWQARVNRDWRFYFKIEDDTYSISDVIPHPK